MKGKSFEIDGVRSLTETEVISINGGFIGWVGNILKVGLGLGVGWFAAEYVRSCA
jgi:hypothetical protein